MGLATQDGLLSQLSTVALNELPTIILKRIARKFARSARGSADNGAQVSSTLPNMQIVVVGTAR